MSLYGCNSSSAYKSGNHGGHCPALKLFSDNETNSLPPLHEIESTLTITAAYS